MSDEKKAWLALGVIAVMLAAVLFVVARKTPEPKSAVEKAIDVKLARILQIAEKFDKAN